MKRFLLFFFSLIAISTSLNAQAFMEGFESTYLSTGWDTLNLSGPTPGIVRAWFSSNQFTTPPPPKEGLLYYGANYKAEGNNGTISTWLFAPLRTLNNGDIFQFYTFTLGTGTYPDRMEIRMSTNGPSMNAGTTPTSVGDFTTLLGVINPSLTSTGYPTAWTKYTYTLSGLPGGGLSGRFAFRYFVTNSGLNGVNGDAIGLDSVYYQPNITSGINAPGQFSDLHIFPNPSSGNVKLHFAVPSADREVIIQDVNGSVLHQENVNTLENSLDLSAFAKGIYFINIREENSVRVQKLILF
jgi:hypothetical protein